MEDSRRFTFKLNVRSFHTTHHTLHYPFSSLEYELHRLFTRRTPHDPATRYLDPTAIKSRPFRTWKHHTHLERPLRKQQPQNHTKHLLIDLIMPSLSTLASLAVVSLAGVAQAYDNDAMRSKSVYQVLTDRFALSDGSTTKACDVSAM